VALSTAQHQQSLHSNTVLSTAGCALYNKIVNVTSLSGFVDLRGKWGGGGFGFYGGILYKKRGRGGWGGVVGGGGGGGGGGGSALMWIFCIR